VVFQEEENAHGKSMEEPTEGIEFPEPAVELNDETHKVEETDMMEMNDSSKLQDSKSNIYPITPLSPESWLGYEPLGGTPLLLASWPSELLGGTMI